MDGPDYESRSDVREWLSELFQTELVGAARAMTIRELQLRPGCPVIGSRGVEGAAIGSREIRAAIADLVRHGGLPIIGDSRRGYYLANTPDELRRGYREMRTRAMKMLIRGRELLDRGKSRLGGQLPLDLRYEARGAGVALAALEVDEDE
jgi:hypothetical protein